MPQLAKGGKWVFGWVTVGADRRIRIPPDAWNEYGFREGADALLLRGSVASGGVAVGLSDRVPAILHTRVIAGTSCEPDRFVRLPEMPGVDPGQRLLAVRGSGLALSLLAKGRIYEMARTHPLMNERPEEVDLSLPASTTGGHPTPAAGDAREIR